LPDESAEDQRELRADPVRYEEKVLLSESGTPEEKMHRVHQAAAVCGRE